MKTIKTLLTLLVFGVLLNIFWGKALLSMGMPAAEYYLSLPELMLSTAEAKRGDKNSISRLINYYGIYLNEKDKELFWMRKGAETGDPKFKYLLGKRILVSNPDKAEAIKLIESSASSGFEPAQEYLARYHRHNN
ncbi:hypothetical protein J7J47_10295 [Halomonas sp. ISL-60]|uniref:hypothetical protein n=1 Tax=Halomonas sp. ISL-56 TaxID=2819149 RepID=UPI001BEC8D5E|nr:hypothetical protein [Halomonas sp. ISL-56]MBT2772620.1 hypothetical protein [Halomonas sp. ISL-60]MBT2801172.1 hypothetical protein [Halomonas sp. ISL-56]